MFYVLNTKKHLQIKSLNPFLINVVLIMLALCIEIKQMNNHVDVTGNRDFFGMEEKVQNRRKGAR